MFNKKYLVFALLCFILLNSDFAGAQFDSHPELDWYTIETPHFFIHYHEGTQRTANTIAKIAEEVFKPITDLYDYKPDEKVTFIVTDVSDIANGATDYYGNRIEIYATALDYDLRGTHNWLRNVITHEFTHAIQIQAAMKFSRKMPAVYLQWLGYENEIRPDVLYGYPNAIVSYPISGVGVPAWFAEGTAQYQRQQLNYEKWDSHRDMILRSYIQDDNLLSWGEMGQFSSITSLKAESIYNLGYALTRYIAEKYGENKLKAISDNLGELTNFSVDKAMKDALGKDGKDIYYEWKGYLRNDYEQRLKDVKKDKVEGKIIEKTGFANYYPQFSPDGKKVSYLSNQDFDYGSTGLFVYNLSTKKSEMIEAPVTTNYSWSPDGKKIIYAKRNSPPTIHHSTVYDIYTYDFGSKKEKKLTDNLRAFSPSYSPDGNKICFVINGDGTLNLYTASNDAKNRKNLTNFKNGEQVYNPKFSPDGKKIIFDYSYEESRKIAEIDIENGNMTFVIDNPWIDYRNPVYSKDGKKIFYSSNNTGIFNIYSFDPDSNKTRQVTNVLGGAFMPSVDSSGNLVYSNYTSTGYKIALLEDFPEKDPALVGAYVKPDLLITKYSADTLSAGSFINWSDLKNFNDKDVPKLKSTPYKSKFTTLSFVPVLRFDTYQRKNKFNFFEAIKPGLYFFSNEVLNRFSIFGGASVNIKGERDLFLQFAYDNGFPFFKDYFTKTLHFDPRFSLEGYNVTRVSDALLGLPVDTINIGLTYNLLSFDFGMAFNIINFNHELKLGYSYSNYAYVTDAYAVPRRQGSVPSIKETYFKASDFSLQYHYDYVYPNRNSDINPIGRKFNIRYDYELSDINPTLSGDDQGNIITSFDRNNLHKLQGTWIETFGLFKNSHSLSLQLTGGTIFGPPVDDFYNLYAAGLPGMKGYPFYSLGGGRMAFGKMIYRFPLFSKIDTRMSPLYLDKLYFSIYGDYGNAWQGSNVKLSDFKKDIGMQLRLQAFSYYVFPTSIFIDAAYGFDKFSGVYQNQTVTYGQEWNFYFGVLFGFDL